MASENSQNHGNYITVKLGKIVMEALVDSGAIVSLINLSLARRLKLKIKPITDTNRLPLFSANGSRMSVVGITDICFYVEGLLITQTVRVCSNLGHSVILGVDFCKSNSVILNYKLGILSLNNDLVRVPLHPKNDYLNCITALRKVCIPAYAEMLMPVRNPTRYNDQIALIEPLPTVQFHNFAVAKALVACQKNRTVCRIVNCKPYAFTIRKGTRLARLENVNSIASIDES